MLNPENSTFTNISLHGIGNKTEDRGVRLSESLLKVNDDIRQLLFNYFLSPFKNSLYYQLYYDADLKLNEIYSYITEIFDNSDTLYKQSVNNA